MGGTNDRAKLDGVHLFIDDHPIPPGGSPPIIILAVTGTATATIATPTPRPAAIQFDPLAAARDAVPLACATAARTAQRARCTGRAAAAAGQRWDVAVLVGAFLLRFFERRVTELLREVLKLVVIGLNDVAGLIGLDGVRGADLARRDGPAFGDVDGRWPGVSLGVARGRLLDVGRCGNIEDVELAASGRLNGGVPGRIMGDMVAIDDIVVPISMARHKCRSLEPEGAFPTALLSRVFRKRKLALVIIPRAQQMNGLYVRGRAKSEIHLNRGRHRDMDIIMKPWILVVVVLN